MKFSITDFFSKYDQIRSFLRIWSHSLKKSVMENFVFCAVILLETNSCSITQICAVQVIYYKMRLFSLTLSWWRPLSYRNQSIDLQSISMDWFLYDNGLRHERVEIHDVVITEWAKFDLEWSIFSKVRASQPPYFYYQFWDFYL